METRAHYVLIGAFVLCTVALAFLFILWLGQTQREFDEYDVVFNERVSGLSVGAAVRFNGIQKGEVRALTLAEDNPSVVIARVRVDKNTPIKLDTRAELELVGFTGLAIIQFVGGSPDLPFLKDVTRGVPPIEADASDFSQFLEGSGDIIASANRLLGKDNVEGFSKIIAHVETLTGVFSENDAQVAEILNNTVQITGNLAEASQRLTGIADNLEQLLGEDAPLAVHEAEATMAEAKALAIELRTIADENRAALRVFTEQGLSQVGPAVSEVRRLVRSLDNVLREVDRDPRGYFLGESAPKYEPAQ